MSYISLTKKDLPVYGVDSSNLKEFTTSKKDIEKNKSRIPDKKYIVLDEEVLKKGTAAKVKKNNDDPIVENIANDELTGIYETKSNDEESYSFLLDIEEDKDDEGRPIGRSSTVYSRDKSFIPALEDFKLIK